MSPLERFEMSEITSEVDCHREEVLDLDAVFRAHAGLPEGTSRGGWACTVSLFQLEDDFVQGQEVEVEIAFASYNIGDDDVCELVDMEVATDYREHGLGRRLVEEMLADIRLKGGARVYLFAYEPEEGDRLDFFGRFGFKAMEVPPEGLPSKTLPNPMWLELDGEV
ncbi:MAG: GNAT family N-acetyltransferase [Thermoplasmata archaeon]|nr:MAG: GNAT family N-acetyltransferase [Thermoplasmata archaeon]